MKAELVQLRRQLQRLNTAVTILAAAINTRSDRDVTLNNELLGVTVDLLAEGNVDDAITYYDNFKGN
jgi:hypothetical protein